MLQKRELVTMATQEGFPVSNACHMLDLSRSSYYYQPIVKDESPVVSAIEQIITEFVTYGTRRVSRQLRRSPYQIIVNRKRAQRIMRAKGWLRPLEKVQTKHD